MAMNLREEIRRLAEGALMDFDARSVGDNIIAADHIESAILQGVKLVLERGPSEAMVDTVTSFPEHLRAEHPDPADEWHSKMEAATLVDRAVVIQNYRAMTQELIKELE